MSITNVFKSNKEFRKICLASFISSIGDNMYNLACTLLLYNITNSVVGVAVCG